MRTKIRSKIRLTLSLAKRISSAAEVEGKKNGWHVWIVIVDDTGRLINFNRMTHTSNSSSKIAIQKARDSVKFQRDTKLHEHLLPHVNCILLEPPNSFPIGIGLCLLIDGTAIGAIGVSGNKSSQDEQITKAGADVLTVCQSPARLSPVCVVHHLPSPRFHSSAEYFGTSGDGSHFFVRFPFI